MPGAHLLLKIHGVPPAESDMQRYFRVSPPSVHDMVVTLGKRGFIRRIGDHTGDRLQEECQCSKLIFQYHSDVTGRQKRGLASRRAVELDSC
jgi:hypothetical protein